MISIGVVARAVGIARSGSPEKPWASLDSSCLGTCLVSSHRLGLDVHKAKRSVEEPDGFDWPRMRSLGVLGVLGVPGVPGVLGASCVHLQWLSRPRLDDWRGS